MIIGGQFDKELLIHTLGPSQVLPFKNFFFRANPVEESYFIELLYALIAILQALWNFLVVLISAVLPWTPLIAWLCFWLFAVNWTKLREVMLQGAWIAVLLIGLVMILIWGSVAPPPDGYHSMFGLQISNYVGKTVYVTFLFCLMFLCGSVQLSGYCAGCCKFEAQSEG